MKLLTQVQNYISGSEGDAWIIYDFGGTNPAFKKLVGDVFMTRKCFVIISKDRADVICHSIDSFGVKQVNGDGRFNVITYRTWMEMKEKLQSCICGYDAVMMDISEDGLMPRSSYVDYGTVCMIKKYVKRLISSADIFQSITATFTGRSLDLHIRAAELVDQIKNEAFDLISQKIDAEGGISEYEVQQYILKRFADYNMVTDSNPIVAIGVNASSPHYEPSSDKHSIIRKGDLVLIDLWAKINDDTAVFGDITWMGYVGEKVPEEIQNVFCVVKSAIDAALQFLEEELPRRKVMGYEVDDVCRKIITDAGYGEYFIHRTGHSISTGDDDHGVGVNMDNYETHDTRSIIDHVAFSIEPGIYMPQFGLREEINVYIEDRKPVVYTPRQQEIILL